VTKPARFRQSDVTRFFKGAEKAGVQLARVEVDPVTGRLIGVVGAAVASGIGEEGPNEWDAALQT
jgi:hypothetical protein